MIPAHVLDKAVLAFIEYLDEDGALPFTTQHDGRILIQTDAWFNLTRALGEAIEAADAEREKWKDAQ